MVAKRRSAKIKLGLIGCGSQGCYLSEAATLTEAFDLVACADIKLEAAQKAACQCGYRQTYSDYRELLSEADLEAVIVATTHHQLHPAALAALQEGKHVLVEKPMALRAAEGQELVEAACKAQVRLMVGYSLRFMPPRLLMKQLLERGVIGEVRQVLAGQCIGRMGGWLGDPAAGGGPLYYIGSHALDQMLWAVGAPATHVSAEMNRDEPGGVETEAIINLRFASGALGQLMTSQTLGGRYGWLDILGTEGRLRVQWESDSLWVQSAVLQEYAHLTEIVVPPSAYLPAFSRTARASLSGFTYIRTWVAELTEFAAAIREKRAPSVTGEEGVRVLEVLDAAFESDRKGARVEIRRV
ncbi:MAG: Gfo/Idh/MocA family protein [Candidatus Zipacnadales bacterium]